MKTTRWIPLLVLAVVLPCSMAAAQDVQWTSGWLPITQVLANENGFEVEIDTEDDYNSSCKGHFMVYETAENYEVIQATLAMAFANDFEVSVKADMSHSGCLNPITRVKVRRPSD